ncbi:MAG: TIGR02444 family protein [Alphaproteobacteria bacterium]
MDFPANPFWNFSLELYRAPNVAQACLALQERHGIDVNFLFFCVWLGRTGHGPYTRNDIAAFADRVAPWHEAVVKPLRAVRRRIKDPVGAENRDLALAYRQRVQKIEIDAEHVEQVTLFEAVAQATPRAQEPAMAADSAARNVMHYFALLGRRPTAGDVADLKLILGAAFAALTPKQVTVLADFFFDRAAL